MVDIVKVGEKISRLRKENNMTQDELANKLYITRQNLSKWENGLSIPPIDTLLILSNIFKISIEDILCLDDEIKIDPDNIFIGHSRQYIIQKIINNELKIDISNIFYQMSNEERMLILKAIKEGNISINMNELYPKLTPFEQEYIRKNYLLGGYLK